MARRTRTTRSGSRGIALLRRDHSQEAAVCYQSVYLATDRDPQQIQFTFTEVVYGVTGTDVTVLPEYGVSP
jgi:hypothetical protein